MVSWRVNVYSIPRRGRLTSRSCGHGHGERRSVCNDIVSLEPGPQGVLATRLTEDPQRSVLLLEIGPDYTTLEQYP